MKFVERNGLVIIKKSPVISSGARIVLLYVLIYVTHRCTEASQDLSLEN